MLSGSNSPYSPLQNPCHISVIFCTRHYPRLFQSFFIYQNFFNTSISITETIGKMTCFYEYPTFRLFLLSLAGFCRGEYGEFDPEIILLQLLTSIKNISHTSTPQYCSIPSIRLIPRNPRYLLYLQYLLYFQYSGNF